MVIDNINNFAPSNCFCRITWYCILETVSKN